MRTNLKQTLVQQKVLQRLLITLLIVGVYRIGTTIPLPGVDYDLVSALGAAARDSGALSLLNLFSGGALSQAAIFSLGVMPYITASILMQLLEGAVPSIKALKKQGAIGKKKLERLTQSLAVLAALTQAVGVVFFLQTVNVGGFPIDILPVGVPGMVYAVVTLLGGFLLLTWLGEMISRHGLGNGLSVLILAGLLATLPTQGQGVLSAAGGVALAALLGVSVVGIMGVVSFTLAQRKLLVTQSKGVMSGRKSDTYIPLKVVQAGVVPVIFTSAIFTLINASIGLIPTSGTMGETRVFLETNLADHTSWLYLVIFGGLIIFCTYFYTALTFKPQDVSTDMRRSGSFLPGVRPGDDTMHRLAWVVSRLAVGGSLLLLSVALLPSIAEMLFGVQQYPLGGVALLIAVSATLDTAKQLKVQSTLYDYDQIVARDPLGPRHTSQSSDLAKAG